MNNKTVMIGYRQSLKRHLAIFMAFIMVLALVPMVVLGFEPEQEQLYFTVTYQVKQGQGRIIANVVSPGALSVEFSSDANTLIVPYSTVVEFTAIPDDGYVINSWGVGLTQLPPPHDVDLNSVKIEIVENSDFWVEFANLNAHQALILNAATTDGFLLPIEPIPAHILPNVLISNDPVLSFMALENRNIIAQFTRSTTQQPPIQQPPSQDSSDDAPFAPGTVWRPQTQQPNNDSVMLDDKAPPLAEAAPAQIFTPPPAPPNRLVFTADDVYFRLNHQSQRAVGAPFIDMDTDRMMVPLRTVAESTGAEARWDYDDAAARIYLPGDVLIIPSGEMLPNDKGSVIIVDDRIFVPLRFVMYAFDASVTWNAANRSAIIIW